MKLINKIQKFKPERKIPGWENAWTELFGNANPDDVVECAEMLVKAIASERNRAPVFDFSSEELPEYFHNTADYLKYQYDGENQKTIEDAESELDYLYPSDSPQKTVTECIIDTAKRLREEKITTEAKESCESITLYVRTISEEEADNMPLLQEVLLYNDLLARVGTKRVDRQHDIWVKNTILLRRAIAKKILRSKNLYAIISSHTDMPLIGDNFNNGKTYFFFCTKKERAMSLAEYRKEALGEDCFVKKIEAVDLLINTAVVGFDSVCYVPGISSYVFLEESDLFHAIGGRKSLIHMIKQCQKAADSGKKGQQEK